MDKIKIGDKVCVRRKIPFTGIVGTVMYTSKMCHAPYVFVNHGAKGVSCYHPNEVARCCETLKDGELVLIGEVPADVMRTTCYA